jgi:hypothetical protein
MSAITIDLKIFFDGIRNGPFPGKLSKQQVQGCTAIVVEFQRRKLLDLRWLAYMLGTAFHETDATMQPIMEKGSQKYLRSKAYWPWVGRGYVQLTWDYNYRDMQKLLAAAGFDVDIVANPDDAMKPDVAAFILFEGMIRGSFRKKKLADYFNEKTTDWVMARNIINGKRKGEKLPDRAVDIANYAKAFHGDLIAAT